MKADHQSIDDIELSQSLRSPPLNRRLPIVLFSSVGDHHTPVQVVSTPKPIELRRAILLECIDNALDLLVESETSSSEMKTCERRRRSAPP